MLSFLSPPIYKYYYQMKWWWESGVSQTRRVNCKLLWIGPVVLETPTAARFKWARPAFSPIPMLLMPSTITIKSSSAEVAPVTSEALLLTPVITLATMSSHPELEVINLEMVDLDEETQFS
ncbi:uncharacterized protein LOC121745427 [Salvia splendens]|uniref:uncharacterized protein LOC121745427 n=1 Tax=Salvia splendens TaxID=180675 RepID=UPI001C253105|nr:uncharacterized protein LOC121745427 [Salvia splendens]